jgi:hypothetical protein
MVKPIKPKKAQTKATTATEPPGDTDKKKKSANPDNPVANESGRTRANAPKKSGQARASGLSEKLKLAAHLLGQGFTALKAAQEAGCDNSTISKLRYGTGPAAEEFRKIVSKSLETSLSTIRTTALARLQQVMETGTDKDAVAAAREAEAMVRNMVTAEAERSKIRIERERLAIQKDQAASGQQQTLGIVMLPQKSDAPWLPAANPVVTPITIPLDHS